MDRTPAIWGGITFAVSAALQVSGYQDWYVAGALFVVALVLFAYALRDAPVFLSAFSYLPFGKVTLSDAARVAYERLRGTLWGTAAERLSVPRDSAEGVLDFMAIAISKEARIYGCRPPSTRLEQIDKKEFNRGTVVGGGKVLNYYGDAGSAYVDLKIGRRDLRRAIKRMKAARI